MKNFIYIALFFITVSLNGQMRRMTVSNNLYSNSSSLLNRSENRSSLSTNQFESIFLQALTLSWVMSLQNSDEKTERNNYPRRICNIKRDY